MLIVYFLSLFLAGAMALPSSYRVGREPNMTIASIPLTLESANWVLTNGTVGHVDVPGLHTVLHRRGDNAPMMVADDKNKYSCVRDGLSAPEYYMAAHALMEWCDAGNSIAPLTAQVFDWGYGQAWVCNYAGNDRQPCGGGEWARFVHTATSECPRDRGARLYVTDWSKEYGYSNRGVSPCTEWIEHHEKHDRCNPWETDTDCAEKAVVEWTNRVGVPIEDRPEEPLPDRTGRD